MFGNRPSNKCPFHRENRHKIGTITLMARKIGMILAILHVKIRFQRDCIQDTTKQMRISLKQCSQAKVTNGHRSVTVR